MVRPASLSIVTTATSAPSVRGVSRSTSAPSTVAATAAAASRLPMDAARSRAVDPAGSSLVEVSGSRTVTTPGIVDPPVVVAPGAHLGDQSEVTG